MANSKYQYANHFEVEDEVSIVQIAGHNFHRFSEEHGFEKPNDEKALNLMNVSATKVLENFSNIVFGYGLSDEYRFCEDNGFQKPDDEQALNLMNSCAVSLVEMFKDTIFAYGVTINTGHINKQYNTYFWMLVKSGKSKNEAQSCLKGTHSRKN